MEPVPKLKKATQKKFQVAAISLLTLQSKVMQHLPIRYQKLNLRPLEDDSHLI